MSMFKALCDTYDCNNHLIGEYNNNNPLCPVAHMTTKAQVEITIDVNGDFKSANIISDKNDEITIIPATEESAGRSSGIAPHPLCDNLTYVAGDYYNYALTEKESQNAKNRFAKYMEALNKWNDFEYNEKIRAICSYALKKSLLKDLIDSGIVKLDDVGKLSNDKISGNEYNKCIVRFRIFGSKAPVECWHDKTLMERYIKYYEGMKKTRNVDICYATGKLDVISDNHPKGILASSYGAKLVSANDERNFTYRGRFCKAEEACTVGYNATQKAHNVLRWLVKQQGYTVGNSTKRTYMCWNSQGKKVPQVYKPIDLWGAESTNNEIPEGPTTIPEYKESLRRCINGYEKDFLETDDIVLISLEAATTGRLSVTYYNELKSKDFFERIQRWYELCCWQYTVFKDDKKPKKEVRTPAIALIVNCAFGIEGSDGRIKASDKVMIMQFQRLLYCVIDKQPLPRDIINAVYLRASQPLSYSYGNRQKVLDTACALISHNRGGKITMGLDRNEKDRSYLYGRLLAVYEKIEKKAYKKSEKREPNAIRLQSIYSQHPSTTRKIIEEAINPYFIKLSPGTREYYRNEIEEISNNLGIDRSKKSLSELYLVGYWAERAELNTYKKNAKNSEEE